MEESKRMILFSIEDQIYSNLNNYLICETIVEDNIDKKENVNLITKSSKEIKPSLLV